MYRLIYRNFATCSTAVEPYRAGEKALPAACPLPGLRSEGEKLSFRNRGCKAGLGITPYTLPPTVHYRDHRGVLISVFLECTGV